ncbi:MAG TPA: transporter [Rhodocyclaceae bacterium]|nr:transporter [Rhodocyclaceae bacterium]
MKSLKLSVISLIAAAPLAAFASHPLTTDDTGVQGTGHWQFELNADRAVERDTRNIGVVSNATLTRGLSDSVDLAVSLPWRHSQVGEEDLRETQKGFGDASIAVKWRLYEQEKLSFSVKPQLVLPTANADKGLGSDRLQPGLTGAVAWGDEKLTLLGNVGYLYANNKVDDRKDIWSYSGAAVIGLTEQFRLVAEAGTYSNSDATTSKRPAFANVGLIFSPTEKLDFDIGYRHGLNKAEALYSVGAGVTVRW